MVSTYREGFFGTVNMVEMQCSATFTIPAQNAFAALVGDGFRFHCFTMFMNHTGIALVTMMPLRTIRKKTTATSNADTFGIGSSERFQRCSRVMLPERGAVQAVFSVAEHPLRAVYHNAIRKCTAAGSANWHLSSLSSLSETPKEDTAEGGSLSRASQGKFCILR